MIAVAGHPAFVALPETVPSSVLLRNVTKRFGHGTRSATVLADLSLEVQPGEFVCLVGPSGCGKSTVLNLMAGLDRPSEGSVAVAGGQPSLLFQEAALFPWLTAAENIEFPLKMRGLRRGERRERVAGLLELVHLGGHGQKRPHELSGGMRQRTALARALAQESPVLLMDEPFGALDALIRDLLHRELERIWQQLGLTIIFVTHDVSEAVRLADRILLLAGRPSNVVAEFPVHLSRPRRADSHEAGALAATITDRLHEEGRRYAAA